MNGVDGVVLVVIQITDDPSVERTAPPCSTHVQPGDVSYALIQQGEKKRLGKTPSSSSTTAWWWWRSAGLQQGFTKLNLWSNLAMREGECIYIPL